MSDKRQVFLNEVCVFFSLLPSRKLPEKHLTSYEDDFLLHDFYLSLINHGIRRCMV